MRSDESTKKEAWSRLSFHSKLSPIVKSREVGGGAFQTFFLRNPCSPLIKSLRVELSGNYHGDPIKTDTDCHNVTTRE